MILFDTIEFLELFGFEFHLDWDGELMMGAPAVLDPTQIIAELRKHHVAIAQRVQYRARRGLEVYVGGPCHGKRHGRLFWCRAEYFGVNISRAHWAVYEIQKDGRAFFRGFASSQKKARRGELKAQATTEHTEARGG